MASPYNLTKEEKQQKEIILLQHRINICCDHNTCKWKGMVKVGTQWVNMTTSCTSFEEAYTQALEYLRNR